MMDFTADKTTWHGVPSGQSCPHPGCDAAMKSQCNCNRKESTCTQGHKWHYTTGVAVLDYPPVITPGATKWQCPTCGDRMISTTNGIPSECKCVNGHTWYV